MSKPEDIPQNVWDEAGEHASSADGRIDSLNGVEVIARAILAAEERATERAAKFHDDMAALHQAKLTPWLLTPVAKIQWHSGQASAHRRYAAAIRGRSSPSQGVTDAV